MDWNKGFTATCYACIVDKYSWRDTERFKIKSDSQITRSDSDLIEAADVLTDYGFDGEQWIRLYMDARQNGATAHVALFTGIAAAPKRDSHWTRSEYSLECYSVLKPAEDILLPRGYFVPEGADGGEIIKTLLEATPAPVEVIGDTPKLQDAIIAEQGESNLSMTMKVLQAINRRIRITGDGTIQIVPKAEEPSARFNAIDNDCVEPSLSLTHDWFSCPNVFRAVTDNEAVTVYDDREDSSLSTVVRGREVWMEETDCNLNAGENLQAYAQRRLKEEQARGYELSYTRRFIPDVTISDLVGLHYPQIGLDDNYRIVSQRINLDERCRTEEEVEYS